MHGDRSKKARSPCIPAFGSLKNAWGTVQKARIPCIPAFGSLKNAWEWPQKTGTPCNLVCGSFRNAWGMSSEGQNPMQGWRKKRRKTYPNSQKAFMVGAPRKRGEDVEWTAARMYTGNTIVQHDRKRLQSSCFWI